MYTISGCSISYSYRNSISWNYSILITVCVPVLIFIKIILYMGHSRGKKYIFKVSIFYDLDPKSLIFEYNGN